jgi:leucyl aminopeptidase (aminopeptidase T)
MTQPLVSPALMRVWCSLLCAAGATSLSAQVASMPAGTILDRDGACHAWLPATPCAVTLDRAASAAAILGFFREADPATGVDLDAITTSIARRSARVQPGELVWIEGGADDVAFMERLAAAVGVEGGHPIVTVYSDEMVRRWYQDVPERFDGQRDEWLWALNERAHVIIRVHSNNPGVYATVPTARLDAWGAANSGAGALLVARGARVVRVGNGLHPSAWRAAMLGVDSLELERIYRAGLLTDPVALAETGERLRDVLRGASTVRVQHPNGTDITVGIGAGRIVVSDGTTALSTRPDQAGGLNQTWLPGGEVTLGLDPGSADGRLAVERIFLDGQAIGPVTFTYGGGRLQALESDMGIPALRPYIDPAVPLSERLTGLKFGLNPDVADPRVLPLMGAGMFSFSMGSNRVLGGDIDLPFMFFLTLAGATVHADEQLLLDAGVPTFIGRPEP